MAKKIKFDFNIMSHRALSKVGYVLVKQARDNMQEISHGRVYKINGKNHIASKPGDTANNLSGDLTSTIRYDIRGRTLIFGAGDASVDYAKYLEGKMNRPNIIKSIHQNSDKISAVIGKLFKDSMKATA